MKIVRGKQICPFCKRQKDAKDFFKMQDGKRVKSMFCCDCNQLSYNDINWRRYNIALDYVPWVFDKF